GERNHQTQRKAAAKKEGRHAMPIMISAAAVEGAMAHDPWNFRFYSEPIESQSEIGRSATC
ncbi:MAG TPA: hypothetical protein VFZ08_06310, partial [Terriglobia bacterium]|nr:hypothetical protein [Terriglobia bacterium]